ncbi:MAG: DUF5680 domain-containing protein [Patescibacteria group bacterium]
MTPEEIQKIITLQEVKGCFFEGGLAGYAGGGKYKPDVCGNKVFTLQTGKLTYVDSYVSFEKQSGGMIVIFHKTTHVPIWMMQYEGKELFNNEQVNKRMTEIVKEALHDAYSKRIFCGGRGLPQHFPIGGTESIENGAVYYNDVNMENDTFAKFSGKEKIIKWVKGQPTTVFYHNYSGKLLVPLK